MRGYVLCLFSVSLLAVSLFVGCDQQELGPTPPPKVSAGAKPAEPPKLPEPPKPPVLSQPNLPYPPGGRVEITQGAEGSQLMSREQTERVKAQVGVGVKGRSLENKELVQAIVTPARSLFATRERLMFEVQIPKAMDLFAATNGRKPNSQEEFWQQIIEANNLKLPELPEGQRYIYDPQAGELMVERPAK